MQLLPPRRALKRLLVAVAAIAITAPVLATAPVTPADAATGTTYHVFCRLGAATGDGSSSAPWSSAASIAKHGAFQPGDRILLKRGSTCRGRVTASGSGTAAAPIVLGAYGSGARPSVVGGGTRNETGAVELANVSYWTVQDLRITNGDGRRNTTVRRAGLLLLSTSPQVQSGLVAQRLTVEDVLSTPSDARAWGGIAAVTLRDGLGFSGLRITNNTVRSSGRTGIAESNFSYTGARDHDSRISGNHISRARGDSIVMRGVSHGRIDHNVSANGSNLAPCPVKLCGRMGGPTTASAAIWPTVSDHIRIDHNEVSGEHAGAGDGAAIDVDLYATHVTVEQNYLHGNDGGGIMFCGAQDTVARFNIIQGNGKAAFWFTCGWQKDQRVKNITITNNTVYGAGARTGAYVVRNMHPNPGSGIRFTNNVIQCSGACTYSWPSKPKAASNTYIGTWSRSEPVGPGTRHGASPLKKVGSGRTGFASLKGYRPRSASAVGTGVRIVGSRLTDVFDRSVNAKKPLRGAAR